MSRIALCGPILAGKSTVSKLLEGLHGYQYINFTRELKVLAVEALKPHRPELTIEMIEKNKSEWRPFLQEFGTAINYDKNPDFITRIIPDGDDLVFDNVRTNEQWKALKELGFRLVKLHLGQGDQNHRADQMQLDPYDIRERMHHPIENSLTVTPWRTYDSGRSSAEAIAKWIAEGGTEQPPAVREHRGNYEQDVVQTRNRYQRATSRESTRAVFSSDDMLNYLPVRGAEVPTVQWDEATTFTQDFAAAQTPPPPFPGPSMYAMSTSGPTRYRSAAIPSFGPDGRLTLWDNGTFHMEGRGHAPVELTVDQAETLARSGYRVERVSGRPEPVRMPEQVREYLDTAEEVNPFGNF